MRAKSRGVELLSGTQNLLVVLKLGLGSSSWAWCSLRLDDRPGDCVLSPGVPLGRGHGHNINSNVQIVMHYKQVVVGIQVGGLVSKTAAFNGNSVERREGPWRVGGAADMGARRCQPLPADSRAAQRRLESLF